MTTHYDEPMCEVCGESHVSVRTDHVGMCDDCFESAVRKALQDAGLFDKACCSVSVNLTNGALQVCLHEYGVEHLH